MLPSAIFIFNKGAWAIFSFIQISVIAKVLNPHNRDKMQLAR